LPDEQGQRIADQHWAVLATHTQTPDPATTARARPTALMTRPTISIHPFYAADILAWIHGSQSTLYALLVVDAIRADVCNAETKANKSNSQSHKISDDQAPIFEAAKRHVAS